MDYEAYKNQLIVATRDLQDEVQKWVRDSFEKQYAKGLMAGESPEVILNQLRTPQEVADAAKQLPYIGIL